MSAHFVTLPRSSIQVAAKMADYLELVRPKIAVMVLVTVATSGFVARWGQPDWFALANALCGVAFVAASASAFNQLLECRTDRLMERTCRRPLPRGRLEAGEVLAFVMLTLAIGFVWLCWGAGMWAAWWGLGSWLIYSGVYTPLKSRSLSNTAVGALAGAMPVLIGWASAGGTTDLRALSVFGLVFLWQFPHFMAIAWLYRRQYSAAGLQMLTVVDPSGRRAGVQAVLGAVALLPVSLLPALHVPGSSVYALLAFLLGISQLICAGLFCLHRDEVSARRLLRASLVYLPGVLFLLMLVPFI